MKTLTNKRVILGVSGSISAYKSPDIVRRLQDLGAEVRVILTKGGSKFITELSLQSVSHNKVHHNLWDNSAELAMGHIELAKWADAILIAPASANTLANIASGKANDLLSSVILASEAILLVAPAMNQQMYRCSAVQENLQKLNTRNIHIIKPDEGVQACGDIGEGRLPESSDIAQQVADQFHGSALSGKNIVITLGATVEKIDPVRFISNHSSGKMGMALVNRCVELGANVCCIHGNISVDLNEKATNIKSISAKKMHQSVMENIDNCDIFIACAAVSDFSPKQTKKQKIKRSGEALTLELIPNNDILSDVCQLDKKPVCIGFAAESQNLIENAQKKLKNKGCDVIIANDISKSDFGFNSDENQVVYLSKNQQLNLGKNSKNKIAKKILEIYIKDLL